MWEDRSRQHIVSELSDQELAVLQGIMRGDRDREIAVQLGVSHSTVRQCGVALRKKMKAKSRTDLTMRAIQLGFLVHPK